MPAKPKTKPAPKLREAAAKKPSQDSAKALLIVESPAKEKTIARYLGSKGYVVRSSYGHIRDLPERRLGVDEKNDFAPDYVILPKAKKILAEIETWVGKSSRVYLATDQDREGESIAWHLVEALDIPPEKAARITFHEITPQAIADALQHPRSIDERLVQAQQARRVLDRLVGYKLSPLLWKKISRGLSAGRVQSAALALLVEREREIKDFKPDNYWAVKAILEKTGHPPFEAELVRWKGEKVESSKTFELFAEPYRVRITILRTAESVSELKKEIAGKDIRVAATERKETRRFPSPPFATSGLQQAASHNLGFTAKRTMMVAQSLYEGVDLGEEGAVGLITYMRTDSFSVAASAAQEAAQYIARRFGPDYVPHKPPVYQQKSSLAQEAHEAIRPTSILREPGQVKRHLTPDQARLYGLIWNRFAASQMTPAVYDSLSVEISCGDAVFRASGRTLKFDGFLKAAEASQEGDADLDAEPASAAEAPIPPLADGERLHLNELKAQEISTSPPPHYNEASLIKTMEKHGIGRPSTYAPTISTLFERHYAERQPKDRRILPTDLGGLVIDKLKEHFPDVTSLAYTAKMEDRLDSIAEGKEPWTRVVRDFYDPFSRALAEAARVMRDERVKPAPTDEKCPICGKPMLLRQSRFGKYLGCSDFPKCKGKISLDAQGKKIVAEETGDICDLCGKPLVYRTGRRGRFIACSGYPACKNSYTLDAEGKKIDSSRPIPTSRRCEKCQSPFLLRLGKRGYFIACSGYPKCRNLKRLGREEGEALKAEFEANRHKTTPVS